jgi:transposase
VHRSWDRHDRLSVISALTISPKRRRISLYFSIHSDHIRAKEAGQFVRRLRRQLGGGKLLLVWDRLNTHRSAAPRLAQSGAISIDWLPPYAPDLNPVEAVWRQAKYADLANFIPDDIHHLEAEVAVSLMFQRRDPDLLGSFFRHAGLPL